MKLIFGLIALLAVIALGWYFLSPQSAPENNAATVVEATSTDEKEVTPGTYTVDSAASTIGWSAKKPLIDGYINSGSIVVSNGTITVGEESATGAFSLDMNALTGGLTAKKPGKEGSLEKHLKGKDFFEVETYPNATFEIQHVESTESSAADFTYTIHGELTMKGKTNEISFPARIFMNEGKLEARASFEIDRTKWGLTYGSGNFFQNLGNNLVADEVALELKLIASPTNTPTTTN